MCQSSSDICHTMFAIEVSSGGRIVADRGWWRANPAGQWGRGARVALLPQARRRRAARGDRPRSHPMASRWCARGRVSMRSGADKPKVREVARVLGRGKRRTLEVGGSQGGRTPRLIGWASGGQDDRSRVGAPPAPPATQRHPAPPRATAGRSSRSTLIPFGAPGALGKREAPPTSASEILH